MTILKASSKLFLLSFLILWGEISTAQQIVEVPLENNLVIVDYIKEHSLGHARNNQVCASDTISLPFFEDFSAQDGVYPNCARWQDNHVFVNSDMAYNPPSVGVATFEGLKWDGSPYNQAASVSIGSPADTLTSQHIDLGGQTSLDEIYLSFFLQKQGLSDRPEQQDSFILEFKDTSNNWVQVWALPGVDPMLSTLHIPEFEQFYIKVDSANYLYNGFQFRFRNLASITGNNDHWHLDYITLDENRANNADTLHPSYGRYTDVAFTHRPTTPLKNGLTAMPWRHFNANSWATEFVVQNFNHNITTTPVTLDRECYVEEVHPGANNLLSEGIPTIGAYFGSPSATDDSLNHTINGNFSTFIPTEKTVLQTSYVITSGGGSIPKATNDTCRTWTTLENYYAYDDGTAETRIIAQGLGTKVAVEYTSEISDTLQGIYFHLPYFTARNAELDFINIKVWIDSLSDSTEIFSRDLHHLQYRYGFNGFYFVDMVDFAGTKFLIPLQAGQKFYVGWQQSFGPEVPVGFDRSTDNRDKTFVGTGATWTPSSIRGTVMIRPLLAADSTYYIPVVEVEEPTNQLKVYPNPTEDVLNLELDFYEGVEEYQLSIHNTMGQEIYVGNFEKQLNLGIYQAGLYILTLRNEKGEIISQQKLIKN